LHALPDYRDFNDFLSTLNASKRKMLNLRTWIKRLTRKTICFSKSEIMHDTVIGLLINKVEFGVDIHAKSQV
jgi:insertion element IS1 protein InsB